MRLLVAFGVILSVGGAATQPQIPPLAYVVASLVGSGVLVRYYTAKVEKQLKTVTAEKVSIDRQKILDDIQTEVLERMKGEYAELASDRDGLTVLLADERRKGAEKSLQIEVQQREIERLHDEVSALRAQIGLEERRDPPGP